MYGSTSSSAPVSSRVSKLAKDSRNVIAESDQMGDNIMGQMHGQRKAIVSTQEKLGSMKNMTSDTKKALDSLHKKTLCQLTFLYSTIFVLVVLICLVAYREITNNGRLL
mmetsp:Transcript_10928/g.15531  ORF Transcript_10928/g.15531 Transcript_10928/m.15531 type:complete len:109 (+) Transcript_10928:84-410(+)